jgi:TIR domain
VKRHGSQEVMMTTDVFISYASKDRPVAQRLATALHESHYEVFWDRTIYAGAEWNEEIQSALRAAGCVIVLWSKASVNSFWVRGEAADAFERNAYVPVEIDETPPPQLFRHVQAQSIANWVKQEHPEELEQLRSAIAWRLNSLPMYRNLEPVADGEPVTHKHLYLVHSCWRVKNKVTKFGPMPYQIHVILYGHPTARARVEGVDYLLPGYPEGHNRQAGGRPERLFELKELANGFCIVQAHVRLRFQARGLDISRLVNMSESGPRLLDDFRV